jgi:CDP-6-deoxy-D-xylo-4-hexulose-3-dehydrase
VAINLAEDTITKEDIDTLCKWLQSGPKLTQGFGVREFERQFAGLIGAEYAVMVNSGSSAILLTIASMIERGMIARGDKIAVPALSWSTDVSSIIQLGCIPILVDCSLDNLGVCVNDLETVFAKEKPSAFVCVSVLGLPPDMQQIVDLCKKHFVFLIEDNCESLLSHYNNSRLGNFGVASCWSLYYGHHISTIEGGMVTTSDYELYNLLLQLRSHGWSRDLDRESTKELREKFSIGDFKEKYTFYRPGFNLRSTDLNALLGIEQLKRVNGYVRRRNLNFCRYMANMDQKTWLPDVQFYEDVNFVSSFALPFLTNKREKCVNELTKAGVECRPLIAGSMTKQPFFYTRYKSPPKKNAEFVEKNGFYAPNHQNMKEEHVDLICSIVESCL